MPKKEKKSANMDAELVEAVENPAPVGQIVPAEDTAVKPPAPAQTRRERKQELEEIQASVRERQEAAVIVSKYIAAQKRNNVITGTITGVAVNQNYALWEIMDGPVRVLIPFGEALPFSPDSKENTPEVMARQKQMLSKSIGATIPFSVEQLVPDNQEGCYLAIGSRRKAMERIRGRFFGDNAANPVKEGDTVIGTFLAVGPHAAWVSVCGLDVRLLPRQLSHRYMEDMMQVFQAGEEIRLRVRRISEQNGKVEMILSARPCELEESRKRLDRVHKGNRYAATITSHRVIDEKNPVTSRVEPRYVAAMWLEGINLPAFATLTSSHALGTAHSGERVMVEVNDVTDTGYVRVRIIAYLPN